MCPGEDGAYAKIQSVASCKVGVGSLLHKGFHTSCGMGTETPQESEHGNWHRKPSQPTLCKPQDCIVKQHRGLESGVVAARNRRMCGNSGNQVEKTGVHLVK
ncbi:unnamed protein product [Pleuronectes platessa]|uniref:Uncharacterized protein n=1 Tax=Pleuronectes platessa TaxID=8262 RepID=A0A9N7Z3I6_PLEPL|nr:unnamed protein product [Pleuronectes platessa]